METVEKKECGKMSAAYYILPFENSERHADFYGDTNILHIIYIYMHLYIFVLVLFGLKRSDAVCIRLVLRADVT